MDRVTTYAGAVPSSKDVLNLGQFAMTGLAKLSGGVLGTSVTVNGFTCTPNSPAALNVILTPGEVYQLENLEATTWSSLPAVTSSSIIKQGILLSPVTISITPPSTTGFSQVFLIEVQYQDSDTSTQVLNYYNAANPNSPFYGPPIGGTGSGTAQSTVRQGLSAYQVKAGTAATTGTQVAPTADAGWTGLFLITVANGATTITSGNITTLSSAPFIPVTLPKVPAGVQAGSWVYATDTGTANNIVVAINPTPVSYIAGMGIRIKAALAPTGATVVNVNTIGNKSLVHGDGSAITNQEWMSGTILEVVYDGTNFQLVAKGAFSQPVLTGSQTYFVNGASGSDSNNGLSSGTAFATIQRAINQAALFNLNGFNISIDVADWIGNNYAAFRGPAVNGSGSINLIGNTTNPQNCSVHTTVGAAARFDSQQYNMKGFKVSSDAADTANAIPGAGVLSTPSGNVNLDNMRFGFCADAQIYALGGTISIINDTIDGGGGAHKFATNGGFIFETGVPLGVLTITTAVTFSIAFAFATSSGTIDPTYSSIVGAGNVTGLRYSATLNGVINTNGGGSTYLPGTSTGVTATGGQYA